MKLNKPQERAALTPYSFNIHQKQRKGRKRRRTFLRHGNLNQQLGIAKNLEQGGTRREQKKNQPKGTKPAKEVDWAGGREEKFLAF